MCNLAKRGLVFVHGVGRFVWYVCWSNALLWPFSFVELAVLRLQFCVFRMRLRFQAFLFRVACSASFILDAAMPFRALDINASLLGGFVYMASGMLELGLNRRV